MTGLHLTGGGQSYLTGGSLLGAQLCLFTNTGIDIQISGP